MLEQPYSILLKILSVWPILFLFGLPGICLKSDWCLVVTLIGAITSILHYSLMHVVVDKNGRVNYP